jgi:hypothetical protein
MTNYFDSFHMELNQIATAIESGGQPLSSLRDAKEALAIFEAQNAQSCGTVLLFVSSIGPDNACDIIVHL